MSRRWLPVWCVLLGLVFLGSLVAQRQDAQRVAPIKDELREKFTQKDYEDYLKQVQSGKFPGGGAVPASAPGADVLVNNNNGGTATNGFIQSETDILAFGNTVVIGFNDAGSYGGTTNHFTGWSYSTNGGVSFVDGGVLPNSTIGDAGDPVLARDEVTGRIYLSTLGFSSPSTIQMFRSDDGGITWLPPTVATPGGSSEDKQWRKARRR